MARSVLTVFALVSLMVSTAPLPAQHEQVREGQGLWFNGGLGYGSLGCDLCTDREGASSFQFGLGGTVSQKVMIGALSNVWLKNTGGTEISVSTLVAGIRFYPSKTSGFYLTGGLGIGTIEVDREGPGSNTESGAGAVLGAGWDLRVGHSTSLTPSFTLFGMDNGDADANVTQFGLSVTIH